MRPSRRRPSAVASTRTHATSSSSQACEPALPLRARERDRQHRRVEPGETCEVRQPDRPPTLGSHEHVHFRGRERTSRFGGPEPPGKPRHRNAEPRCAQLGFPTPACTVPRHHPRTPSTCLLASIISALWARGGRPNGRHGRACRPHLATAHDPFLQAARPAQPEPHMTLVRPRRAHQPRPRESRRALRHGEIRVLLVLVPEPCSLQLPVQARPGQAHGKMTPVGPLHRAGAVVRAGGGHVRAPGDERLPCGSQAFKPAGVPGSTRTSSPRVAPHHRSSRGAPGRVPALREGGDNQIARRDLSPRRRPPGSIRPRPRTKAERPP